MRIIFLGTPDFAVASLRALVETGHDVVGVVTMPDKPAGRGLKTQESAVKQYAVERGLRIFQPEKLRDPEFLDAIHKLKPDLGVVIAFRMLPQAVWAMPRLGTLNLHASLLPQYRGAAPINWAIINGEKHTGVTTFMLNEEIDKGAILGFRRVEIAPDDTAGTLHDKLMAVGAELVLQTVDNIETIRPIEQPAAGELKPAPKIFRDDCRVNWGQPTERVRDFIRGLSPCPAAWSELETGETLKIFATTPASGTPAAPGTIKTDGRTFLYVACTDGWLALADVQLAGKRRMPIADLLRGRTNLSPIRHSEPT